MSQGVLYMATGKEFINEAIASVASVREQMPDVETALATDEVDMNLSAFDRVIELDAARQETIDGRSWLINSTLDPDLSPFDKTLYLDSDTYVWDDVSELFDLLDQYDLAVARTPGLPPVADIPAPWQLYNCGVIAYRDSPATTSFLNHWQDLYQEMLESLDRPVDQPAFATALYEAADLRWYTLPRRYNVRVPRRGSVEQTVKIVHGRHPAGLKEIASELNQSNNLRIFRERSYLFTPALSVSDQPSFRFLFEKSLAADGASLTLFKSIRYVINEMLGTEFGREEKK